MATTARGAPRRPGRAPGGEDRAAAALAAGPGARRPGVRDPRHERLELIHRASLDILEQVGSTSATTRRSGWRDAGAEVERYRVRIPGQLLMDLVGRSPSRFTVHARNPERSTEIGGAKVAFSPTYGSPFVYDFNNERRYGTLADLHQFHQLAYLAPAIHNTGAVVCEPVDIAIPKRHLHITYSAIKHSDKPFMGRSRRRSAPPTRCAWPSWCSAPTSSTRTRS